MWAMSRPRASDRDAWKNCLVDSGRLQMRHVSAFMHAYPQDKYPDLGHQLITASPKDLHKTRLLKQRISGSYTAKKDKGFVYSPQACSFTVNVDFLEGITTTAKWFNTKLGDMTSANIANKGTALMTPPFKGTDWILIIEKADPKNAKER